MVFLTCPCPQAFSGITETTEALSLLLEVHVIGLEAGVASHTYWVAVTVASLALVTSGPSYARTAEAAA